MKLKRRSFLTYATASTAAVTLGAGLWGLGRTMAPDTSTKFDNSTRVDLNAIPAGQQVAIPINRRPVFIHHLTPDQQQVARSEPPKLHDPFANNANIAADAAANFANRTLPNDTRFVILWGICTRRGCVPTAQLGDFGGWFCPCGASHYDLLGRVRKGIAPRNMLIPRYEYMQGGFVKLHPGDVRPTQKEIDALVFGTPQDS